MTSLRHVILTRFNIASAGREQEIRLRPGWLDARFDLFDRYCLPGVEQQTNQAFEWVVLFDVQTPDAARRRIEAFQSRYPFRAVFTGSGLMNEIALGQVAGTTTDWLLTSRLDSDDVLAKDLVERLHRVCDQRRQRVINFDNGVILSLEDRQTALYLFEDDCNPFSALLEPTSATPKTIWGEMHRNISRLGPMEHVKGAPAWMQVVHGGNVTNSVRGRRIPLRTMDHAFPSMNMAELGRQESGIDVLSDNLARRPARFARRVVEKAGRKLKGT